MKARPKLLLTVSAILFCFFWFYIARKSKPVASAVGTFLSSTPSPVSPLSPPLGASSPKQEQQNDVTNFLTAFTEGMKKAGIQVAPSIAEQLRQAVATNNHTEIVRAFHEAIYGRGQKMAEVLPVVREYLSATDPFIQYTAARTLYTAGDRSGFETLLRMVSSRDTIPEGKQDLRVEAARELAKFREKEAVGSIVELYRTTAGGGLLSALSTLGGQEIVSELQRQSFYANKFSIVRYGILEIQTFVPQIAATFQQTTDLELKNAAAWALARAGDQNYVQYLTEAAQPAINAAPKDSGTYNESEAALRYLGSLQSPIARQVLESALDSNDSVAVRYAVVNLLFNQVDGSEKARQVVLRELRGEQRKLGAELMLNIASKLDDPEIRAAGEAFDQRSGDRSWKLYAVERRQWPIYNWIDEYVVVKMSVVK
jgi:HEAT repeat protein